MPEFSVMVAGYEKVRRLTIQRTLRAMEEIYKKGLKITYLIIIYH